jgi:hypothetical protein
MAQYKPDCAHYLSEHQRVRPYCDKLNREIRPSNCSECTLYVKASDVIASLDPAVIRLLQIKSKEQLGLEGKIEP